MGKDASQESPAYSIITDFLKWVSELNGRNMLYRGLSDKDYAVSSSILRRLQGGDKEVKIPPKQFITANKQLLDDAKLKGYDKKDGVLLGDLELLAELQHQGAATCLIDFTQNPLIALWFACRPPDNETGKVVETGRVVAFNAGDTDQCEKIKPSDLKKNIENILDFKNLHIWQPGHQNERITAQQSFFVFGKPELTIPSEHTFSVKLKNEVLAELKKYGISAESLFCDFDGYARILNYVEEEYPRWTAEQYYNLGQENHTDHKLAINYYNKALTAQPPFKKAYYQRGRVKADMNKFSAAIEDYTNAIKFNSTHAEAYYHRGVAKLRINDEAGAIEDCNNAISKSEIPNFGPAYLTRGVAKLIMCKYEESIADFDKVLEINPTDATAYHSRGFAKGKLEDHMGAIADFDKVLEINPNYATAYHNRGFAKGELEDHMGAIADFDKALEIKPNYATAYHNRGVAKAELKNYKGAIADFDKALKINPNYATAYHNRGFAKGKLEDHMGAIADFDKALEINPNYATAYNNRGFAKDELEDYKGAIADYDKALKINPKNADSYYNRGVAKIKLGDQKGALADFKMAKKLAPNDPQFEIPDTLKDD